MSGSYRITTVLVVLGAIITVFLSIPAASAETEYTINDLEYFEMPGLSVHVFHNTYYIGRQGGIEIIQHGERVVSNGFLRLDPGPDPFPKTGKREVNREKGEIRVPLVSTEKDFNYTISVRAEGEEIRVTVDLEKPLPAEWVGRASMNLELYPTAYFGKSFYLGDTFGIFPRQGNGPMVKGVGGQLRPADMAKGSTLSIAPEDPLLRMEIRQVDGDMSLFDQRITSPSGWFIIRSLIPAGKTKGAVEWVITPNVIPNWRRNPVITHSQVGYHPDQVKQAIIELDSLTENIGKATLERIEPNGEMRGVFSAQPEKWGKFLRYEYAVFDFTSVVEPGMYVVRYGNEVTQSFQINKDVFRRDVWQPTLETFFPVQMCHVEVRNRTRVWHGACHLDDAMQAPTSHEHFDGYRQGEETETSFAINENIPGMNRGGWHDAGDYDLAAGSQASTTHYLTLAREAFGVDTDQTRVELDKRLVNLSDPDGIPDIVQQIENGVENLLTGYRASGHSFAGIIANSRTQYGHYGDAATITDNKIYDPSMGTDEVDYNRSGRKDDRYAFTNKDTSLEYKVAGTLAAASRVLRKYNNALAEECLSTAVEVWKYEQTHEPVEQRNAYVPRRPQNQEVLATVELLITTKDETYRSHLLELLPVIINNVSQVGWLAARAIPFVSDDSLKNQLREALREYKTSLDNNLSGNPYGIRWRPAVWGVGWNLQEQAVQHYYLVREFPELFDREILLRVVNYVLGCHPGSPTSFISGVGARSLIHAYGTNRAEWSYIPGGNAAGTALVRPDFPEMKEPFPFLWQQTEYVMPGAATYIFCILAADKLLNK